MNSRAGVGGGYCVSSFAGQTGARILRMEPSGYQGLPGYDSFLIGRAASSRGGG